MSIYSYFAPTLLLALLVLSSLRYFLRTLQARLILLGVVVIGANLPIFSGDHLVAILNTFIYLLSIPSVVLLFVLLIRQLFPESSVTAQLRAQYAAALWAMSPILVGFYAFSFDWTPYYWYTYGFQPEWIFLGAGLYAWVLLWCSLQFVLFNLLLVASFLGYLVGFLGNNFWNYWIDPFLIILCLCHYGALIVRAVSQYGGSLIKKRADILRK